MASAGNLGDAGILEPVDQQPRSISELGARALPAEHEYRHREPLEHRFVERPITLRSLLDDERQHRLRTLCHAGSEKSAISSAPSPMISSVAICTPSAEPVLRHRTCHAGH